MEVSLLWQTGRGGPHFFEETTYRVRVKSLGSDQIPTLIHRDPSLFQDVDAYPDDYMCAGPFNFRSQVGLSNLEIRVGHESLRIIIEVFPTKLDYQRDYKTLLSDVAAAARGLALEYLRSTYRLGAESDDDHPTSLEWVTLLRNQIAALQQAVHYVNQHPYHGLSAATENVRADKIKRNNSSVRQAIIKARGRGTWLNTPPGLVGFEALSLQSKAERRSIRLSIDGYASIFSLSEVASPTSTK